MTTNGGNKKKPTAEFMEGSCKIAVWEDEVEGRLRHSLQIGRIYKDGEGQWKTTPYIKPADLGLAMLLAPAVSAWVRGRKQARRAGDDTGGVEADDFPF